MKRIVLGSALLALCGLAQASGGTDWVPPPETSICRQAIHHAELEGMVTRVYPELTKVTPGTIPLWQSKSCIATISYTRNPNLRLADIFIADAQGIKKKVLACESLNPNAHTWSDCKRVS